MPQCCAGWPSCLPAFCPAVGGGLWQLAAAVDVIDYEELSFGKLLGAGACVWLVFASAPRCCAPREAGLGRAALSLPACCVPPRSFVFVGDGSGAPDCPLASPLLPCAGAEGAVYAAWFLESPVAVKKFERAEDSLHEVEMYLQLGSHDNVVALRWALRWQGDVAR